MESKLLLSPDPLTLDIKGIVENPTWRL